MCVNALTGSNPFTQFGETVKGYLVSCVNALPGFNTFTHDHVRYVFI